MKLKPRLSQLAFAFVLNLFSVLAAFGQEKPILDPPELITKREDHLRAMQRVTMPELQAYATKLNLLKQQFTREGKLEAGLAVDNELRDVTRQLQTAQDAGNATKAVAQQLTLVSAVYGHLPSKRTVNVERILRQAMTAGQATIKLNNAVLNNDRDPAPYAPKDTVINYVTGGQKKEKTFREGYTLDFKNDLQ